MMQNRGRQLRTIADAGMDRFIYNAGAQVPILHCAELAKISPL